MVENVNALLDGALEVSGTLTLIMSDIENLGNAVQANRPPAAVSSYSRPFPGAYIANPATLISIY